MSKIKKIYTSKSEISIKVLLDNGKTVRVAFTPRTMGSSVFMTDDEELQKAIEGHKEFGKLFVCKNAGEVITATASQRRGQMTADVVLVGGIAPTAGLQITGDGQPPAEPAQSEMPTAGVQDDAPSEDGEPTTKIVPVGSIQEAKDYLADKFDITRSSIKSRAAIEAAALSVGVVFDWLSEKKS